jgi:hypothetical protein
MHQEKYYQIQRREFYAFGEIRTWGNFYRFPYSKFEVQDHYNEEEALNRAKIKMEKLKKQKEGLPVEYRIVKITKTTIVETVAL